MGSLYLHIDHTAHAYAKMLLDVVYGKINFRNEIAWCYSSASNSRRWFPRKHDTLLFYTASEEAVFNRDSIRIPYKALASKGKVGPNQSRAMFTEGHDYDRLEELLRLGKVPEDWWDDIYPAIRGSKEREGYPTQKPVTLCLRIIEASSCGSQPIDIFSNTWYNRQDA